MSARRCACVLAGLAAAILVGCTDSDRTPDATTQATEYADTDIAPGPGTVTIELALPEGTKLNEAAPTKLVLQAGDAPVKFAGGKDEIVLEKPTFPVETPVTFEPGEGTLKVQYVVYYCSTGVPEQCYSKRGSLDVAVIVKDGAKATGVRAVLAIEAPPAVTGLPDLLGGN